MEPLVEDWIINEFSEADLGDERRTRRLLAIAQALSDLPQGSFAQATNGDKASLKALYRFFDTEAIEADDILTPHILSSWQRISSQSVVLAIQDTTEFSFKSHPATSGLGPTTYAQGDGFFGHTTLAVSSEGVALGLLGQRVWARDPEDVGKTKRRYKLSVEEKESYKWIDGLHAVNDAKTHCPDTHLICVGDRESDVFDLLTEPRSEGVELLVRAAQNRRVDHPQAKLWQAIDAQDVVTTLTLDVPRRGNQKARQAKLTLRFCNLTLHPPLYRKKENLSDVTVSVVALEESQPPKDVEPIRWILLSTLPVETTADAIERVAWYTRRWLIELFHKILKSGCRIEARQLGSIDRLFRCLPVYSVIAWRILYATFLGRALPQACATLLLDQDEWKALYCAIHETPILPDEPPLLEQAIRWIAQLGGFLGRKNDGQPGVKSLWLGLQRLHDLTLMFRVLRPPS